MNKAELIRIVAQRNNLTLKDTEKILNDTLSVITQTMISGQRVQLVGFGAFEVRERAPRQARNPQTGETVSVSASRSPVFKPGKPLKDAIADSAKNK